MTCCGSFAEGGIKGASSLAKSVALDQKADEQHRFVAVQAAAACDDQATLREIAKALVKKPEIVSPRLAASLSQALYPRYLSTDGLLKVIGKSKKPDKDAVEGFGYQLQEFYDKAPDSAARAMLFGNGSLPIQTFRR